MILNDDPVELMAIHARGHLGDLTTSSIDQRESWTTMGESVDFVASQRCGLGQPISVHARSKSISDPAAVAAARCRVSALLS